MADLRVRLNDAEARAEELSDLLAAETDAQRSNARGGSRAEQEGRAAELSPVQREYDRAAVEVSTLRRQLTKAEADAQQEARRVKSAQSAARAAALEPLYIDTCDRAAALLSAFGAQARTALESLTETAGELDRESYDAAYHSGRTLHVQPSHQLAARRGLRLDLLHALAALVPPDA